MAIYLGGHRVSPSLNTIIEKTITITKDTNGNVISTSDPVYSGISNESNFTIEDPDNLSADLPTVTEWTRPSGWPNLDALPTLTEGVYLTYDNTSKVDYKWACFYCDVQSSGQITIAQGHINGNSFVQDATWNVNTATYKEINYSSSAYDYVVFKITPTTATKHIVTMYFGRIAQATLGTIILRPQQANRCLERRGWLPYLSSTGGSGDNLRFCTEWMQRDFIQFGNAVTSLYAAWFRGRSLKKIEFGTWTGENCNINNLSSTFEQCYSIEKIDLSNWKTHNWHVTTVAAMFSNCVNMKICQVPFDTVNWGSGTAKTFTLYATWNNCCSLEILDLGNWDVHDLTVNRIDSCWAGCYHLKSLNVKNWVTSKWTCNTGNGLYCLFYNCRRLVDIDLSGWDTSNWAPTRADSMFYFNASRRNFDDIKNWNTSNWKIVQFSDAFGQCHKIQELDLSRWNTSAWKVSTLSNTFGSMYSVRHIRIGNWNTSSWAVTNINYVFTADYNLEELEWWNWDTSNWAITNGFYQTFDQCYKIKEVDFTNWNTSNWNLKASGAGDLRYMFRNCYTIKKINMSNINVANLNSLNYYGNSADGSRTTTPFYYCTCLEELTLPQNYAGHIDFTELYLLPRTEIIKAFNALKNPPLANTAKIWIYGMRYKLTTADIAIATNKGYTVVQS